MKLRPLYLESLSEGKLSSLSHNIDDILAGLAGKVMIIADIKTTSINPHSPHSQIIKIGAVVINSSGDPADYFSAVASLNINTINAIYDEKNTIDHGDWPPGKATIMDMLDLAGYEFDPDDTILPSEMEIVVDFKSFIDKYAGNAVLVVHNARNVMHHLNSTLPTPLRDVQVFDTLEFTKIYFEPVLQALMMHGNSKAHDMAEKLSDDIGKFNTSLRNLSRALGIKKVRWELAANDAQRLADILSEMLKFLNTHSKMFRDANFRMLSAKAVEAYKNYGWREESV